MSCDIYELINLVHQQTKYICPLFIMLCRFYICHFIATDEQLNLAKQMLELKQREIDDLTSLLKMKEGNKMLSY